MKINKTELIKNLCNDGIMKELVRIFFKKREFAYLFILYCLTFPITYFLVNIIYSLVNCGCNFSTGDFVFICSFLNIIICIIAFALLNNFKDGFEEELRYYNGYHYNINNWWKNTFNEEL